MKKLNIGIVGAGRIGNVHAQSITYHIPQAQILRVTDVKEDAARALAEKYGIPAYSADYMDIVNDPANPDVVIADTLEELAEKCGIEDVDQFLETVEEYNDMCESQDTLFYKPSKYMKPIKKGPFYAGCFRPSGYGTLGGIKINDNCEVMDDDWNVIPGFYAAGTDTCTIYGDSYMFLLPGNTMGYCLNTGRFAGQNAAEYCDED